MTGEGHQQESEAQECESRRLSAKASQQSISDPTGKFKQNWKGPYLVKIVLSRGAIKLMDSEGNEFSEPTDVDRLKKYYV